nr:unnamed protein product [Digitaria exilis]
MPCYSAAHLQKPHNTNIINQPREVGHHRVKEPIIITYCFLHRFVNLSQLQASLYQLQSIVLHHQFISNPRLNPGASVTAAVFHSDYLVHITMRALRSLGYTGVAGRVCRGRLLPCWRDCLMERRASRIHRLFLHILQPINVGASGHLRGITGIPANMGHPPGYNGSFVNRVSSLCVDGNKGMASLMVSHTACKATDIAGLIPLLDPDAAAPDPAHPNIDDDAPPRHGPESLDLRRHRQDPEEEAPTRAEVGGLGGQGGPTIPGNEASGGEREVWMEAAAAQVTREQGKKNVWNSRENFSLCFLLVRRPQLRRGHPPLGYGRRRMEAADRSMDDLCDALMVEEILPRLSPKSLICLGCVSRRYNAMVTDPDFSARYWLRAGVFIQPLAHSGREPRPLFLSSSGGVLCSPATSAESMFGADLAFLPAPSAREKAYLRPFGASYCIRSTDVVMHSAAGLLLAAWMALPELPCPPAEWQSGLLRVDTDGDAAKKPNKFQVLLFNHPFQWRKPGGCFDLRLFSSDTGQWKTIQLHPPIHVADGLPDWTPIGQSGRAYCIVRIEFHDHAILYSSDEHSVDVIRLPTGIGTSLESRQLESSFFFPSCAEAARDDSAGGGPLPLLSFSFLTPLLFHLSSSGGAIRHTSSPGPLPATSTHKVCPNLLFTSCCAKRSSPNPSADLYNPLALTLWVGPMTHWVVPARSHPYLPLPSPPLPHAAVLTFLPLPTPVASPTARRPSSLPPRRRRRPSLPPSSFPAGTRVRPSDPLQTGRTSPILPLSHLSVSVLLRRRRRPIRDAFTVPEHPRGIPEPSLPFLL